MATNEPTPSPTAPQGYPNNPPDSPARFEVPHLPTNLAPIPQGSAPVAFVDRRVIWAFLHWMHYNGFGVLTVDDELIPNRHIAKALEAIRAVDDARVVFARYNYPDPSPKNPDQPRRYWARLVLGNSGWDVISDWGVPGGDENHPFNMAMHEFCNMAEKFA